MERIEILKNDETLKQILEDSFGGVMYSNKPSDYNTKELLEKYNKLEAHEKELLDGCISGAISFAKGE